MIKRRLALFLFLVSVGVSAAEHMNCISIMNQCAICHGENADGEEFDLVLCNFPIL